MLLLLGDGFPKSGKRVILYLVYHKIDSVHGRGAQVIMGAGAFDGGNKADVAFVIAGGCVKEGGKVFGFD